MYNKAISRFGLNARECLVLEDNEKGIKAALGSGAHLLEISIVEDVNYQNIKRKISEIEGAEHVEHSYSHGRVHAVR